MAEATSRTAGQHFTQPDAWLESQFAPSVPSTVHWTALAPLPNAGQSGVLQAPAAQSRSHAQAASQSTSSHASVPVHVTVHVDPAWQNTLLQALAPTQLIVQVHPDGHVTLPHESADVHSTGQIRWSSSHPGQSPGQFGTTQ